MDNDDNDDNNILTDAERAALTSALAMDGRARGGTRGVVLFRGDWIAEADAEALLALLTNDELRVGWSELALEADADIQAMLEDPGHTRHDGRL